MGDEQYLLLIGKAGEGVWSEGERARGNGGGKQLDPIGTTRSYDVGERKEAEIERRSLG